MTRTRVLLTVCLSGLAATSSWSQQSPPSSNNGAATTGAQAQVGAVHVMKPRDASTATANAATQPNIPYNGGQVLPNSTTYAIFWGSPADFPPDYVSGIDQFLTGLNGSQYLAIADQYMFGQKTTTRFGGNYFYSASPPPPSFPQGKAVGFADDTCNALSNVGIEEPDPTGVYILYTSNFPSGVPLFCAFHGYLACGQRGTFHVDYVPNFANCPVCTAEAEITAEQPYFQPNRYSVATNAVINGTAHEFMEAITDPNGDGWIDPSGNEVGDPCIYIMQNSVPLTTGSWPIQEIYSDQANGCVQGAVLAQLLGASTGFGAVTTFNIPGAAYGIFGQSISGNGAITGSYVENLFPLQIEGPVYRGFLRNPMGTITPFDAPGALLTLPTSINSSGIVGGTYFDAQGSHGFLRDQLGNFTTIDVLTSKNGISASAINTNGSVAGSYRDSSGVTHGYVRDPLGGIASFDGPGSPYQTLPFGINESGAVVGLYSNLNQPYHGFLRDPSGDITTIDVPAGVNGTEALSINQQGAIAGTYTDVSFIKHAFLRSPSGAFTTFDAPGAVSGTIGQSINNNGAVAGYFSDANGVSHGFVRDASGNFTILADIPKSINDYGMTTGYEGVPLKK